MIRREELEYKSFLFCFSRIEREKSGGKIALGCCCCCCWIGPICLNDKSVLLLRDQLVFFFKSDTQNGCRRRNGARCVCNSNYFKFRVFHICIVVSTPFSFTGEGGSKWARKNSNSFAIKYQQSIWITSEKSHAVMSESWRVTRSANRRPGNLKKSKSNLKKSIT
jgi:hypothetical protein